MAPPDAQAVMERMAAFEGMTWADILEAGCHKIELYKLEKAARDRLVTIGHDDLDDLMSFRITGPKRIWCVTSGSIMRVLWWDPGHQVYKTEKDKADRKKRKNRP